MKAAKLIESAMRVTSYFVTKMAGTGLSTNSIIAEHSSLAGISLTI